MVYAHGDEAGLGRRNKLPRLMDCVVDPRELLAPGSTLRLNGYYYITKQVHFWCTYTSGSIVVLIMPAYIDCDFYSVDMARDKA